MTKSIGFIVDQSEVNLSNIINPSTTQALIKECLKRKWSVFTINKQDLYLKNTTPYAKAYRIMSNNAALEDNISLNDLDLVLIRQKPSH